MASCESYQAQLLSYLYDLLEADEQQALRDHLGQCAACQAALTQAQRQQQMLAVAAKAAFPAVRFQPPATEVVPADEAALRPTVPFWGRPWRGWALAASILLLLGLGGTAATWSWSYSVTRQKALALAERARAQEANYQAAFQAALTQRQQAVEAVQERLQQLETEQQQQLAALERAARERQFDIVVSGPETIQTGAPNQYQVVTRNRNHQPVPSHVDIRVRDAAQRLLFEKKDVPSTGQSSFLLPPNLPAQANGAVSLEVVARQDGGQQEQIHEQLALAAPVFLTHLTTDKPMYRPGETVHFRSLTLDRFSLKPAQENFQLVYMLTKPTGEQSPVLAGSPLLVDPQTRSPLLGPDKKPLRGVGAGQVTLDPQAPGGEYTLTVRDVHERFAAQERKFLVNQYENPRLNKELDFTRKSYGPGDEVVAACKVSRVEGGSSVARQPVGVTIRIDGKTYGANGKESTQPLTMHTDDLGTVKVAFKLPSVIEKGQGSLSVQFHDGASIETLVRPLPIVVKKLQVEFFPEGGDLVAGVPNRVYFQARTLLDKPAELKGHIVDQEGRIVVDNVETLHDDQEPGINQGLGLFTLTPQVGRRYELRIATPAGIEGKYLLPATQGPGVTLTIPTGVTAAGEPIRAVVQSSQRERRLLVGAYCRGRLLDHQSVTVRPDQATTVDLHPAQEVGGVYRVTVFEERDGAQPLVPVAERLVYRKPAEQLLLNVQPDKKQYTPGDHAKLSLSALNEKEQPAPAVLLVAVVDKSVVTMADEKTFRSMPTHYLLTTEVRRADELEYADVLLGAHPKAAAALDLLLGTQGWRRFAEQDPHKFRQQFKDGDADRLLVMMDQSPQKSVDLLQRDRDTLRKEFATKQAALHEEQARAQAARVALQKHQELPPELRSLQSELAQARQTHSAAEHQLARQRRMLEAVTALLPYFLGLLLLGCAGTLVVLALRRSLAGRISYGALASVCVLLAVGVGVSLYQEEGRQVWMAAGTKLEPPAGFAGGEAPPQVKALAAVPPKTATKPTILAADAAAPRQEVEQLVEREAANRVALRRAGDKVNEPVAPAAAASMPQARGEARNYAFRPESGAAAEAKKALAQHAQQPDNLGQLQKDRKPEAFFYRNADGRRPNAARDKEAGEQEVARARLQEQALGLNAAKQLARGMPGGAPGMPPAGGMAGGFGGRAAAPMAGPVGQMRAGGMMKRELAGLQAPAPPPQPLFVREYAHVRPTSGPADVRSDFVDTAYWHPVLVLPDGKADVAFDLSDAVTTYQVMAVGHTLDGRLGTVTRTLEARLPFTLEPKLPVEVTSSDRIDVPVSIANNTADARPVQLQVAATGMRLLQEQPMAALTIPAEQRVRRLFRLQPLLLEGQARLELAGQSAPFTDQVARTLQVVPEGFPIVGARSDVLEKVAQHEVVLPEQWVPGTLQCQVQVYPSTLADLQKGLEALLREPGGCFEQTSTSNYPNLLILDYLKESDQAKPETVRRARELLARGYQKLTAFECLDPSQNKRQGYEWFGGTAPAHEALTAYGLLEFRDMARVFDVDANMLERTRRYLMSRKDGKGGFQRNPRALDHFGRAPDDITNAYIVWALTESGKDDDVTQELAALATQARTSKDPYFLALVATSLLNRSQADEGITLLKTVAVAQKEDGHVDAARTSITGSGGRDLQIETTGLAVLGWLKANRPADFNVAIQKAIKWIGQQRGGYGGFGSTQSTILALKAIIAFTKANKKTSEAGVLRLFVGEANVGQLTFPAGVQETLVLRVPEPEKQLQPGQNSVRVEISGKNTFPYTLRWSYQTRKPASAENCPVQLSTHLDRATAAEGETVHLTATVENATAQGQGMAVAIVGLPAGLTLPEDMKQLKEHARLRNGGTEKGLIAAWETRGRELVLYWRDLAPKQKIEVPIDLICRVPGDYSGPASRAYLYYNADQKCWVEPLKMTIAAKTE